MSTNDAPEGAVDLDKVDVPRCREIVEQLRELGVSDEALAPVEIAVDEVEAWQSTPTECALCGHDPACGHASISTTGGPDGDVTRWFCHADDHSCYMAAGGIG